MPTAMVRCPYCHLLGGAVSIASRGDPCPQSASGREGEGVVRSQD